MAKFVANPRFRSEIDRVAADALDQLVNDLVDVFKEAFDDITYYWDSPTLRKSGEVATSPRSNVDSGELRDSIATKQVSKTGYEIAWIKPYAIFSLLGGVNRADGSVTPPKPWIDVGLSKVDIGRLFAFYLGQKLT